MTRAQFDRSLLPSTLACLQRAGVAVPDRGVERRCNCPIRAHSSTKPFSFNAESGAWWCHACGIGGGDSLALHQAITGQTFREAATDLGAMKAEEEMPAPAAAPASRSLPTPDTVHDVERKRKVQTARDIWQRTVPLAGTIAAKYLLGRGCRLPPADGDLRFIADLPLWGLDGLCLVGRISKAKEASEGIGVHLTWLQQAEGHWVRSERRYLGSKAGGVVRLWLDEAVFDASGVHMLKI